jgi:hypothetical protein
MHAKRVLSLDYDLGSLTALLIGIIGISAVSFLASSAFDASSSPVSRAGTALPRASVKPDLLGENIHAQPTI